MRNKDNKKNHVFGPILSRRLGWSLGIDIVPYKTCSYDCVYCECGGTNKLSLDKFKYVDPDIILNELDEKLKNIDKLNYITFSGSGEPTLNVDFPYFVKEIKKRFPEYKLALLTNTSTICDSKVYFASLMCDLYVPSVDSVLTTSFNKINRPSPDFNLENMKEKLLKFSHEYKNTLWVEVFLAKGVNDRVKDIKALSQYLSKLKYDKIQINSLDRPGTESWVKPIDNDTLDLIKSEFKNLNYEIVSKNITDSIDLNKKTKEIEDIVLNTIKRRPLSYEDILSILKFNEHKASIVINNLINKDKIAKSTLNNNTFYVYKK